MVARDNTAHAYTLISDDEFSTLKSALSEFAGSSEYAALVTHHAAANKTIDPSEKLLACRLFQEALEALLERKTTVIPVTVRLTQVAVHEYVAKLSATLELLDSAARPVPKIMHFVWVGGSDIGAIQRDYMNIWRQVLAPQNYRFNLWYDSEAFLAHEMNRVILDSARTDAMESGGDKVVASDPLAKMIEDRARVLKRQMFEYLNQPQWAGRADEARIDLMVRAYGKDRSTLEALLRQAPDNYRAMAGEDLQLRDVRQAFNGHFLFDVYQREIAHRGNFAAASDVVRLQAGYLEGGRYSDVDYLPALADKLGGVDITGFSDDARIGVLQLLLNHDDTLMPGRDAKQYWDRTGKIPELDQQALITFARSKPGARDIFVAPEDILAPTQGFRTPEQGGNAHFIAHAGSDMIDAIMQVIRFNYDILYEIDRRLTTSGHSWGDTDRLFDAIENVVNEYSERWKHSPVQQEILGKVGGAVFAYFRDGIRIDARGTVTLSGPGAAFNGLNKFIETRLLEVYQPQVRDALKLTEGFNALTEEELRSGWTVSGDPEKWLATEQEKWSSGKLDSRYAGRMADLLKEQTLTFKQGWPVIEGKPLLLTSVLQQLMDELGEPFIRAMKDKLSGEITFDTPVNIGFDIRQQITAQPLSELPVSHGAESTSNLNELFSRVAHGSLNLEQLSPLLRVMLGGLFGASSLDAAGFADAWQQVSTLAQDTAESGVFARYNAIEKILAQRRSAQVGTSPPRRYQPDSHTSRELKVIALNEALTLRQWTERITQINRTAQQEYRGQILQRGGQVRDLFYKAGAVSSRQMPQELLMHTAGDPGRRCYPLALLMAAALARGEQAERALIGRVSTAGLTPDEADSRALLLALDELHDAPLADVGNARGLHRLESVTQILEAKTTPAVLLLDTGNHALLVAKVMQGDTPAFRFYDPNFAIFGFAGGQELTLGMALYLSAGNGAMARLYGLSDITKAQINVIELNTTKLADTVLSSHLRLDGFLQNAAVTNPQGISVWENQAMGRTRALTENARMGAGLAQLDARYWTQEFAQATDLLRAEHKLGREYLPLLETVEKSPESGYTLTMVDGRNPQNTIKLSTADSRFSKVRQHLHRLVKHMAGEAHRAGEADGGSRLSFAFAIQTLITEMRNREYQAGEGQVPALSIAMQVQVYVSYAQLSFGVLNDTAQMISLVRQVAASEQALAVRQSSLSGRLLGRTATVAGIGFSLVNIGFDVHGLVVADNQEQRSRLATQLVFDVVALGLDLVALAVGGTVGAVAAFLSVPLLGIGIGVTAIASNLGQISDKAKAVGAHLRKIQDAYGQAAYTRKDGVLTFEPEAVITDLDLQGNKIRFDSQKFFPMVRGGLELPQYVGSPKEIHRAIDIRDALELPAVIGLIRPAPGDVHTVVLPCTPLCYYGYEYQVGTSGYPYEPQPGELRREPRTQDEIPGPGALSVILPGYSIVEALSKKTDAMQTWYPSLRNSAVNKLEFDQHGNRRFYFFANSPFPHILYKLYPVNKPTLISITLDEHVRQLLVPALPAAWQQCISYEIFTRSSGVRQLWLTPGLVAVSLRNYAATQWVLHAPWASEKDVVFAESFLSVDGIRIEGLVEFIELANGELFKIDWQRERLILISVTLRDPGEAGRSSIRAALAGLQPVQAMLARIRALSAEQRIAAAFVPLRQFRVPMSSTPRPAVVTAFYDVARTRLLYARNLPHFVNDGIVLAAVNAMHAWFYHPERATVWRVDAITGTVNHRYRLLNPVGGSRISGCEQTADGLRVRQTMLQADSAEQITCEYLLVETSVFLTHIDTSAAWGDYTPSRSSHYWHSLIKRLDARLDYADDSPGMAPSLAAWWPKPFVQLRSHVGETLRDLGWIRLADQLYFQLNHASGLKLDTVLLYWNDGIDAPLFYSKSAGLLRRGADVQGSQVIASDVIDISKVDSRYVATLKDGGLWEVDKQGMLKFVGVGPHWLRNNSDWIGALPALAARYRNEPFPIIGLSNVSGSTFVAAWCIDAKAVLVDSVARVELALLGLTPDRKAAWLLDVAAKKLLRQPLVEIDMLREAFGSGTRLLHAAPLPKTRKVWPQWRFVEVSLHGEGLLGRTDEGMILQLLDQQPARVIRLANNWSHDFGQPQGQLHARLRALKQLSHEPALPVENTANRCTFYVPALDRLFDVRGRADGQWPVFLGTRGESVPLLFDPVDGLIFSEDAVNDLWLPGSYARREGQVLSLEVSGEVSDLMAILPDGVNTLLLAFGPQTLSYRLSDELWQRLDCIVIESRQLSDASDADEVGQGALVLDMAASERLLLSQVDGQLVFTDPDNAHSLIVRDGKPDEGEPGRPMQISVKVDGQLRTLAVGQWLQALSRTENGQAIATLKTVLETGN